MVLIVVFAPAHLTTDSLFAAITDLSANMRRKDIMRSGLWPPVGFAARAGLQYQSAKTRVSACQRQDFVSTQRKMRESMPVL